MPPVDRRLVEPYLEPDWSERGALVGTLARAGEPERIVALASYARLRDPSAAEVAFAVSDEEQGRGIGTRLLEQLALRAGGLGITRFVADVLAENSEMLVVFADAGFETERASRGRRGRAALPDRADRRRCARASPSATTSPSPHRCGRSSSRGAWP